MVTILGFGASTMQGVGDPAGGFLRRVEARCAGSFRFINKGIGGETTRDMLARLAELGPLRPFHTVVLLGSNDFPRAGDANPEVRTDESEYAANVRRLLLAVRGGRSLFISSFLVSERLTGIAPATFEARMGVATTLALDAGYQVWDLYRDTRDKVSSYLAEDGLHFNADGHELIAAGVMHWLTETPAGE